MARRISFVLLGVLLAGCGSAASGGGPAPTASPSATAASDEAMHTYGQKMSTVVLMFSSTLDDYFQCEATHEPNICESAHALGDVLQFTKLGSIAPPPQAQAAHAAAVAAMTQLARLFPGLASDLPALAQVRALGPPYLAAMNQLAAVCPDCDGADAVQRWNSGIQPLGG